MTPGLVAGRFHVRSLLGSGGTASVFAAVDEQTGRDVALKLLHPHLAVERSVWDAFFEEVHAAQSIDHPGLAEIYDAGVEDSEPPIVWISMERVEGMSLAERVREHGPLEVEQAVALAGAVLDALAAAHEGGVVHRDVTPANVMLDAELLNTPFDRAAFVRSIRLLDFGLADVPGRTTIGADALLSGTATAPAGVVASVPYASPEQLSGDAVSEASDLYQVGATLHFALTGRPPFAGDTRAVVRAHLSSPPPVPSASRRGVPRTLDRVVTTAMLKRPEDRYADAAAMAIALAAAAGPLTLDRSLSENRSLSLSKGRPDPAGVDPDAPTDIVAAAAAIAATAPDATGVTRVYRTSVPLETASVPRTPAAASPLLDDTRSGNWQSWAIVIGVVVVLSAVIGLSALAASNAPSPLASASGSVSSAPAATTPVPTPTQTSAPTTRVPEIVGMSIAEARTALERQGLALGDVTRENSSSQTDVVLGASPGAGEYLPYGRLVALRVATGENAIPPVLGMSAAEAAAALTAAGFPSHVTEVSSGPAGTVVSATPGAGEVARVGTTVLLSVPRTPPPTATPVPTTTPTNGPTPVPTGSSTPFLGILP